MQQAARVSDQTAFFNVKTSDKGGRTGYLVEYEATELIFNNPQQEDTKAYISGRFG
jgi:phosphate transport system ATP-binding protein